MAIAVSSTFKNQATQSVIKILRQNTGPEVSITMPKTLRTFKLVSSDLVLHGLDKGPDIPILSPLHCVCHNGQPTKPILTFFHFYWSLSVGKCIDPVSEEGVCIFYACLLPQHDFSADSEGSVRSTLKLAALGTRPIGKVKYEKNIESGLYVQVE